MHPRGPSSEQTDRLERRSLPTRVGPVITTWVSAITSIDTGTTWAGSMSGWRAPLSLTTVPRMEIVPLRVEGIFGTATSVGAVAIIDSA